MTTLLIIFVVILLLHLIMGLCMFRKYPQDEVEKTFSLIVISHNEERMLMPLLESLDKLIYNKELYEIILVDDNSTDKTWDIISTYAKSAPNITALKPNPKYHDYLGKKAGLQSALDLAKHEILLFTDADATVPPNWISSLNTYFTPKTGMVIGYIRGAKLRFIKRYKRIVSSGIFAAACGLGFPFSCSGGNLAVRKQALLNVGGYESIKSFPSGDDKQLLNLINKTSYRIAYNSEIKVIERPRQVELKQAYQQARRHYGKLSLSSPLFQVGFILIAFYYLSVPVLSFWDIRFLILYLLSNLFFHLLSCIKHQENLKLEDIFINLIYPYYMLYFTLVGSFSEVKWKK